MPKLYLSMEHVISQPGSTSEDSDSPDHGPRGADGTGYDEGEDLFHELLATLAEEHAQTAVFAMGQNGVLEPVPESLDLHGHRVATVPIGCNALDLVTPEYKARVIEAWERLRQGTHSRVRVRLLEDPRVLLTLDYFDTRRAFGLYMVVGSGTGLAEDQQALGTTLPDLAPRFARELKDELALIIKVDEGFTQVLGWSSEEVLGKRTSRIRPPRRPGTGSGQLDGLAGHVGPGRRVRLRHLHRNGSWVWVEVTNHNLLDDPDYGCVVAEMVDISEEMATLWRSSEGTAPRPVGRERPSGPPGGRHRLPGRLHQRPLPLHDRCPIAQMKSNNSWLQSSRTTLPRRRGVRHRAPQRHRHLRRGPRPDARREGQGTRYCSLNLRALTDEEGTVTGAIVCVDDVTESVKAR